MSGTFKHGGTKTREYGIWRKMVARCHNPAELHFPRYGAKGITVCAAWRESFANFLADMGTAPSRKHSVDRFPDQNGNYEPGNVRWATPSQQSRNLSTNRIVEFRGEKRCVAEWAEITGIAATRLYQRLDAGWSIEDALTVPHRTRRRLPRTPPADTQDVKPEHLGSRHRKTNRLFTYKGVTQSLAAWSRVTGINRGTILTRIDKLGWSVEDAFELPVVSPRRTICRTQPLQLAIC